MRWFDTQRSEDGTSASNTLLLLSHTSGAGVNPKEKKVARTRDPRERWWEVDRRPVLFP